MKISSKIAAFILAAGLAVACSAKNDGTSQGGEDSQADSVQQVAPESDGTPTDGSTPSNPGSPPDSAAQATDSDSI